MAKTEPKFFHKKPDVASKFVWLSLSVRAVGHSITRAEFKDYTYLISST